MTADEFEKFASKIGYSKQDIVKLIDLADNLAKEYPKLQHTKEYYLSLMAERYVTDGWALQSIISIMKSVCNLVSCCQV